MVVMGILGSPRLNGKCAALLKKALEGAASRGAAIKSFELANHTIKYCTGCCACFLHNPDLPIGTCCLKDDMAALLAEWAAADGYILATPVYDKGITALMKTFYERMIALTYRPKDAYAQLPRSRVPANFQKKASIIVTGNCGDEKADVMAGPCFDAFQGHLMIQMVDTVDRLYVGGMESMTERIFARSTDQAYAVGRSLVDAINNSRHSRIAPGAWAGA